MSSLSNYLRLRLGKVRMASRPGGLKGLGRLHEPRSASGDARDGRIARAAMRKWRQGELETVSLETLKARIARKAK